MSDTTPTTNEHKKVLSMEEIFVNLIDLTPKYIAANVANTICSTRMSFLPPVQIEQIIPIAKVASKASATIQSDMLENIVSLVAKSKTIPEEFKSIIKNKTSDKSTIDANLIMDFIKEKNEKGSIAFLSKLTAEQKDTTYLASIMPDETKDDLQQELITIFLFALNESNMLQFCEVFNMVINMHYANVQGVIAQSAIATVKKQRKKKQKPSKPHKKR